MPCSAPVGALAVWRGALPLPQLGTPLGWVSCPCSHGLRVAREVRIHDNVAPEHVDHHGAPGQVAAVGSAKPHLMFGRCRQMTTLPVPETALCGLTCVCAGCCGQIERTNT